MGVNLQATFLSNSCFYGACVNGFRTLLAYCWINRVNYLDSPLSVVFLNYKSSL